MANNDELKSYIRQKAKEKGVDENLALSIAYNESRFNPNATSYDSYDKKGKPAPGAKTVAHGVMQLIPSTAARYGLRREDIYDSYKNVDAGISYLSDLSKRYNGDARSIAGAYHAGEGAVDPITGPVAKKGYGPKTRSYVDKVDFQELAFDFEGPGSAPTSTPKFSQKQVDNAAQVEDFSEFDKMAAEFEQGSAPQAVKSPTANTKSNSLGSFNAHAGNKQAGSFANFSAHSNKPLAAKQNTNNVKQKPENIKNVPDWLNATYPTPSSTKKTVPINPTGQRVTTKEDLAASLELRKQQELEERALNPMQRSSEGLADYVKATQASRQGSRGSGVRPNNFNNSPVSPEEAITRANNPQVNADPQTFSNKLSEDPNILTTTNDLLNSPLLGMGYKAIGVGGEGLAEATRQGLSGLTDNTVGAREEPGTATGAFSKTVGSAAPFALASFIPGGQGLAAEMGLARFGQAALPQALKFAATQGIKEAALGNFQNKPYEALKNVGISGATGALGAAGELIAPGIAPTLAGNVAKGAGRLGLSTVGGLTPGVTSRISQGQNIEDAIIEELPGALVSAAPTVATTFSGSSVSARPPGRTNLAFSSDPASVNRPINGHIAKANIIGDPTLTGNTPDPVATNDPRVKPRRFETGEGMGEFTPNITRVKPQRYETGEGMNDGIGEFTPPGYVRDPSDGSLIPVDQLNNIQQSENMALPFRSAASNQTQEFPIAPTQDFRTREMRIAPTVGNTNQTTRNLAGQEQLRPFGGSTLQNLPDFKAMEALQTKPIQPIQNAPEVLPQNEYSTNELTPIEQMRAEEGIINNRRAALRQFFDEQGQTGYIDDQGKPLMLNGSPSDTASLATRNPFPPVAEFADARRRGVIPTRRDIAMPNRLGGFGMRDTPAVRVERSSDNNIDGSNAEVIMRGGKDLPYKPARTGQLGRGPTGIIPEAAPITDPAQALEIGKTYNRKFRNNPGDLSELEAIVKANRVDPEGATGEQLNPPTPKVNLGAFTPRPLASTPNQGPGFRQPNIVSSGRKVDAEKATGEQVAPPPIVSKTEKGTADDLPLPVQPAPIEPPVKGTFNPTKGNINAKPSGTFQEPIKPSQPINQPTVVKTTGEGIKTPNEQVGVVTKEPKLAGKVKIVAQGYTSDLVSPHTKTKVKSRFTLVDARDPVTSHDDYFGTNKLYPQKLQPRVEAKRRAEAFHGEEGMIENFTPEMLGESGLASQGAPTMNSEGQIESGNGRAILIRKLYKGYPQKGEQYKAWLVKNAKKFGLDPDQIAQMEQPMLVRSRESDLSASEQLKVTENAQQNNMFGNLGPGKDELLGDAIAGAKAAKAEKARIAAEKKAAKEQKGLFGNEAIKEPKRLITGDFAKNQRAKADIAEAEAQQALKEFNAKSGELGSGFGNLNPNQAFLLGKFATKKVEAMARRAAAEGADFLSNPSAYYDQFSQDMEKLFGQGIRPHMENLFKYAIEPLKPMQKMENKDVAANQLDLDSDAPAPKTKEMSLSEQNRELGRYNPSARLEINKPIQKMENRDVDSLQGDLFDNRGYKTREIPLDEQNKQLGSYNPSSRLEINKPPAPMQNRDVDPFQRDLFNDKGKETVKMSLKEKGQELIRPNADDRLEINKPIQKMNLKDKEYQNLANVEKQKKFLFEDDQIDTTDTSKIDAWRDEPIKPMEADPRKENSWLKTVSSGMKANLLSRLSSAFNDVLSTGANIGTRQVIEEPVRAITDKVLSYLPRVIDTPSFNEKGEVSSSFQKTKGGERTFTLQSFEDLAENIAAAYKGTKKGRDIALKRNLTEAEIKDIEKHEVYSKRVDPSVKGAGAINKGLELVDSAINAVGRVRNALDEPAYQYALKNAINSRARVIAENTGKPLAEIKQIIKKFEESPKTLETSDYKLADEIVNGVKDSKGNITKEGAKHEALYITFKNDTKFSEAWSRLKSAGWEGGAGKQLLAFAADQLIPFARTQANILKQGYDITVDPIIKGAKTTAKAVKQGGLTVDDQGTLAKATGRAAVGLAVGAAGYGLGKSGAALSNIEFNPFSGEEKQEKELNRAANRDAGSIKIGNRRASGNVLGSFRPVFNLGTNIAKSAEDETGEKAKKITTGLLDSALTHPVSSGLRDLTFAAFGPEGSFRRELSRRISSGLVPAIVSDIGTAGGKEKKIANAGEGNIFSLEGVKNFAKGTKESIQEKLPLVRDSLPDNYTALGDVNRKPLLQAIDPTRSKEERKSKVISEYERAGIGFAPLQKKEGENAEDFSARAQLTGKMTKKQLEALVESSVYGEAPKKFSQLGTKLDAFKQSERKTRAELLKDTEKESHKLNISIPALSYKRVLLGKLGEDKRELESIRKKRIAEIWTK